MHELQHRRETSPCSAKTPVFWIYICNQHFPFPWMVQTLNNFWKKVCASEFWNRRPLWDLTSSWYSKAPAPLRQHSTIPDISIIAPAADLWEDSWGLNYTTACRDRCYDTAGLCCVLCARQTSALLCSSPFSTALWNRAVVVLDTTVLPNDLHQSTPSTELVRTSPLLVEF